MSALYATDSIRAKHNTPNKFIIASLGNVPIQSCFLIDSTLTIFTHINLSVNVKVLNCINDCIVYIAGFQKMNVHMYFLYRGVFRQ